VVLVVTQYNFPEPSTDIGDAIMHPALKLNLDGFKLHNHSLFRSNPPDGEGSALVALPTVVGEAKDMFYKTCPWICVLCTYVVESVRLPSRVPGAPVERNISFGLEYAVTAISGTR
jgi:hypothetical protein